MENLIARLDPTNLEFSLLGDMNADMASTNYDDNVRQPTNIADIYDLSQLISEPTWISGKLEKKNRQFCLKLCFRLDLLEICGFHFNVPNFMY